jgi:hypothetical protein
MTDKKIYIIKADGVRELFDRNKLEHSLRKIGTTKETADMIVAEVEANLKEGNTTKEIYRLAFSMLRKRERPVAVRYSLKRAIAELGPSGFPFEKYISQIFRYQGYETLTGQILLGTCVPHEVDVVAWKADELILMEAKFHSDFSTRSDLKVALYVKARFDDLLNGIYKFGGQERKMTKGILITNTKFSSMAIQYGECAKLSMVGWNYPQGNNLHQMIENNGLVPLTALTSLTQYDKKAFLANDIVLAKQLKDLEVLRNYGFDELKAATIIREVEEIEKILK